MSVPGAQLRHAVDRDPRRLRRRRPPLRGSVEPRLRRDRHRRRPAGPGRRDRACRPTCSTPSGTDGHRPPVGAHPQPAATGPDRHHPPRRGAAPRAPHLAAVRPARSRLEGDARLFRRTPSYVIDEALGRPHDGSVTWVRSSSRLNGDVHTAAAAFDGDPATAWTTVRARPQRQWVEVLLTEPVTVDTIPLTVIADGCHSVPTEVEVSVDGTVVARVPLPEIVDGEFQNGVETVDVPLPEEVTGSTFRLRFTGVRPVTTNDWVSENEVDQPLADRRDRAAGRSRAAHPRDVRLGVPRRPRHRRRRAAARAGHRAQRRAAGRQPAPAAGLRRPARHPRRRRARDRHGRGRRDRARRRPPRPAVGCRRWRHRRRRRHARPRRRRPARSRAPQPTVEVASDDHDRAQVEVTGATPGEPFWLVLGQSHNVGWTATADGDDLGEPVLVDGFANGWLVTPTVVRRSPSTSASPRSGGSTSPSSSRCRRGRLPGPAHPPPAPGRRRSLVAGRALLVRARLPLRRRAPDPAHRRVDRGGRRPARPRDRRPGCRARPRRRRRHRGPPRGVPPLPPARQPAGAGPVRGVRPLHPGALVPHAQLRLADRDEATPSHSAGWPSSCWSPTSSSTACGSHAAPTTQ